MQLLGQSGTRRDWIFNQLASMWYVRDANWKLNENGKLFDMSGIVFNLAYVQQAVCSPSRTAMMTGLRPDTTRVWDLETHFRVAQPDCITLPQYFKANGYHCTALSKIYHAGFEDGRSLNEPPFRPKPH